MLVTSLLSFTATEENLAQVLDWFLNVDEIYGVKLTAGHKHSMTRQIFTSRLIPEDVKAKVLANLQVVDSSDKFELTRQYCSAAIPNLSNK